MENKHTFFARLEGKLTPRELTFVRGAYVFAKFGHRAQKRKEHDANGNCIRYFEHVRRTAIILMDELKIYDAEDIAVGLLHDCVEDTEDVTAAIIEQFFSTRVSRDVMLLTKRDNLKDTLDNIRFAPERVVRVKLCDRVDNSRSFEQAGHEFAIRKSGETLNYYVPLFRKKLSHDKRCEILINEVVTTCLRILQKK